MAKTNFDKALEMFLDKFLELHPKDTWPDWFKSCTTYGGTKAQNSSWRFEFTAILKKELGKNESWEFSKDGKARLVKIDPKTGEKRYVISNTADADSVLKIFEAVIDPTKHTILVMVDKDLDKINGEDLRPL